MSPLAAGEQGHWDAYRDRCDKLWQTLEPHGWASVRELTKELGWSPHEIRAKLVTMRSWELVDYDPEDRLWKTWNS